MDTPQTCHIVFPADPNATLSDEVLEAVAGGTGDVPESDYYRRMKGSYWSD